MTVSLCKSLIVQEAATYLLAQFKGKRGEARAEARKRAERAARPEVRLFYEQVRESILTVYQLAKCR